MVKINEEAINEHRAFRPYDRQLHTLLSLVLGFDDEKTGNSVGLSLVVNGSFISGLAITHQDWTDRNVESLRATDNEVASSIATVLEGVADIQAELTPAQKSELEAKEAERFPSGRHTINLMDATVRSGSHTQIFKTMRVLMDSVDAWSLEQLSNR